MSHAPFTHEPEFLFDLGEAGSHPIHFTTWIWTDPAPEKKPEVRFIKAVVEVSYADERPQHLNVTKHILADASARAYWEAEILSAYAKAKEKLERDYDEGA